MEMNKHLMVIETMLEGNEEGDETIEYFKNLIKENEKIKKQVYKCIFKHNLEGELECKKIDDYIAEWNDDTIENEIGSRFIELQEDFAEELGNNLKLKKENEKLEELAYDYIDGGKTCASVLKNYRDEMNIIQKLDEDESELEDIVCVAPYIKKLKEQIKNYKINEESRELLINELKTKNIELKKNQSSMTDYDIGTIYEMINSMDFDPNLNLYTGFRDFDFEEFLENVKSKMHNDTMIIIPNDLKEAVELQSKIHKDYAMRRDRMQDYIRKFKKDKEDRVKILKEELKKLEKELNIY